MSDRPEDGCHIAWADLPRAHGTPPARARWRVAPEDFVVEEELGFEPSGGGQHMLLRVRKRGANTVWVARELARLARVPAVAVGFCGLKDRDAVTSQWFSVDLGGRPAPDWSVLRPAGVEVLTATPHDRKLRRGAHRANRFTLRLHAVEADPGGLEARLARTAVAGVPNYFGEQRFGRDEANPERALAMLSGAKTVRDRASRSIYLSAARAVVFNRVLAARVAAGTWDRVLAGDVLMLDGRRSWFLGDPVTDELVARVGAGELHPTGALCGRGALPTRGEARLAEEDALAPCEPWCTGLARAGLEHERRALRVIPRGISWEALPGSGLALTFTLPAGAYATAVLRELVG